MRIRFSGKAIPRSGGSGWPASYDASFRVSWRQLQPTDPRTLPLDAPDDRKFDSSVIDDALTKLVSRLRLTPSWVRLQLRMG
jgi:hypothetical protein